MTVGYMKEVATVTPFTFCRLLARWRGSIWRSIRREFMIWLFLYYLISLIYRIALFRTSYGESFEKAIVIIDHYLNEYGSKLNFVAAFYMSYVGARWWVLFLQGRGPSLAEKERQIRMTICKYWNLSFVILLREISVPTKKKFPTMQDLCPDLATLEQVRLLSQAEIKLDEGEVRTGYRKSCVYFLPLCWMQDLIKKSADDGNFLKIHLPAIYEEIAHTRQVMLSLLTQNSIFELPALFTQVALVAPFVYFMVCLVGKQYIVDPQRYTGLNYTVDYVVPFYTIYEFIIYVGWIKAAMSMLNPFGLGQDDFEVEYLIKRNEAYSRVLLDDLYEQVPKPKDFVFCDLVPKGKKHVGCPRPLVGSTANINVAKLSDLPKKPATPEISTPNLVPPIESESAPLLGHTTPKEKLKNLGEKKKYI
uniref:Bestrophin homolog n=1 Tax=Ditylenchus dipsaci TaxID=166011 RepID=A0A915DRC3_9BILA